MPQHSMSNPPHRSNCPTSGVALPWPPLRGFSAFEKDVSPGHHLPTHTSPCCSTPSLAPGPPWCACCARGWHTLGAALPLRHQSSPPPPHRLVQYQLSNQDSPTSSTSAAAANLLPLGCSRRCRTGSQQHIGWGAANYAWLPDLSNEGSACALVLQQQTRPPPQPPVAAHNSRCGATTQAPLLGLWLA